MRVAGLIVLALLLCVLGMSAFGQVTINMSDIPIEPGAVLTKSMGANFNTMTAAGQNQTWDFSASVTVIDYTETWDNPEGHYGAEDFPNANLVMFGPMVEDSQQLTYFHRTPNSYSLVGAAFYNSGDVITIPAETTGEMFSTPLNYGDEWDFVSTTEYESTTTVDSSHFDVDAWGTLVDLNGSYECLRVRVNRTTTTFPTREVQTVIAYYWYAPDWGEVVSIYSNYDEDNPQFDNGTFIRISDIQGWVDVPESDPTVLHNFTLEPAYPNPFNANTTLEFTLPNTDAVKIVVLNTLGQQVALVADGVFASGPHRLTLDAAGLSSGTYFVRLTSANQHAQMQRITLLK